MLSLALAAILFVGIHVFVSATPLRGALVARLGERGYLGAFSLASGVLLVWMIWAFGRVHQAQTTALVNERWIAAVLVFVAFLFIVYGNATRGPTAVGGERKLDDPDAVRGIHRITRHPFLVGMALWSGTHLLFNPEAATAWLFGAFFVLSLLGPRSIDGRRAKRMGEKWTRYAQSTSVLPFVAVLQGRNRVAWSEFSPWPLLVTIAVYAFFIAMHARFFGVSPI
jgi:uncharacterized membrane protein